MEPTLYILMRNDLDSLNPGKAIAQGSHATNIFEKYVNDNDISHELKNKLENWRDDRDFGRCLCVAVNGQQLELIMDMAENSQFPSGMVVDPTYPIRDGEVTHAIELATCGYIFAYGVEFPSRETEFTLKTLKKLSLYD